MTTREKNQKAKEMIQQKINEDGFISNQDKRKIMARESGVMDNLSKAALSHADAVGSSYARVDRNQYNCPHVFSFNGRLVDIDQLTTSEKDIAILEEIIRKQELLFSSKQETMMYLYSLRDYLKSQCCIEEVEELLGVLNG